MVVMISKVLCTLDEIFSCYHVTCTYEHSKKKKKKKHGTQTTFFVTYLLLLNFAMTLIFKVSSYFCLFHLFLWILLSQLLKEPAFITQKKLKWNAVLLRTAGVCMSTSAMIRLNDYSVAVNAVSVLLCIVSL